LFSAIAAAYTVDRVKDRIVPGAFEKTIAQWRASGKRIPLHWDHRGDAANVIGSIDPAATREVDRGLYVEGKLDLQDSDVAREAWRSMKNDAVSLSFGYVTLKTRKRGGINDLLELDLFEVSIVPHPANPDTRVLSTKAALAERRVPTDAAPRQQAKTLGLEPPLTRRQLRRRSDEIALQAALGFQPPPKREPAPDDKSVPTERELRRRSREVELEAALGWEPLPESPQLKTMVGFDYDALRQQFADEMVALLALSNEGRGHEGRGRSPLRAHRAEYRCLGRRTQTSKSRFRLVKPLQTRRSVGDG
jgi:Escherichia/Staphylococcus phage prohead protease